MRPVPRGAGHGQAQDGINDHIAHFAPGACVRHHPGRAVERIARLGRRRAPEQHEFAVLEIGFGVGHGLKVIQKEPRAHPEGQAAIRAVLAEILGAVGGLAEAAQKNLLPPVLRGVGEQKAIGLRAELGHFRIGRSLGFSDGPQAVHVPFAEEVAAVHYLRHQLLKGNALPLALAAFARALQTAGNPERIAVGLQHGRPAPADRGPLRVTAVAVRGERGQSLSHGRAHGQLMTSGQRVVRIARSPYHAVRCLVDMQAHAAEGGTAPALVEGHALPLDRRGMAFRIYPVLGNQGILMFRVGNGHTGRAFAQAPHHAPRRIQRGGGENSQPHGGEGAFFQKITFLVIHVSATLLH